ILIFRVIVPQNSVYAQSGKIKVTGKVVDVSTGVSLPGVSISVEGTTIGVVTDVSGNYTIEVPDKNAVLVFSYIGYLKEQVTVSDKTTIDVQLSPDVTKLEEVVVVGYGTVKKRDLTGAVASVSSSEIAKQPVVNITQSLQGKDPGTIISSVSGAPGAGLKIRVRGANSIAGSNDPLYVVDGVVYDLGTNELSVNDIERVEILKDASATAIYGSRGANGVIMITTKRGENRPASIQITATMGIGKVPYKYKLLDAATYATTYNVYKPGTFSNTQIEGYKQNGGVDWQDQVFQTGITQNYGIGVTGGNSSVTYYLSGNYINQTGIVTNTNMSKYSLRSNVSSTIGKHLKVDLNMFASRTQGLNNNDNGSKGSPVWLSVIYSPTASIYNADGTWNRLDPLSGPGYSNPLMTLKERHSDYTNNTLSANTKLSYEIIKGLKFDVTLGADNISSLTGNISNGWITGNTNTSASLSESKTYELQNSNVLTFNKKLGGVHDITLMAGNEQTSTLYQLFSGSGNTIDPISVGYDNLGLASTKNVGSSRTKYAMQSFFGRAMYSFKDKYLFTATYRADGTSKFQGKNKWGYFPSTALAWRVSEESFLKDQLIVSNLKIRASWGVTGNQSVPIFATLAQVSSWSNSYGQASMYPGTYYTGADNPDLKWESTTQSNVGFDLSVLKGILSLTADYYVKNTNDLLLAVTIPDYDGGGSVYKNVGKIQNKGWEVTLTATPISTKGIKWDFSFNVSSYKNKVINLGKDTFMRSSTIPAAGMFTQSPFVLQVGQPMGSIYGYVWQGVYKTSEATEAAKYGRLPGDNKYLDVNNDGKIDGNDQKLIGHSLPKFVWGFSTDISYKNLSLNIMLQAVSGRQILNTMYAASSAIFSDATAISSVDGLNYWSTSNENAKFQSPTSNQA
ncbi:MAG TPA: TonB-dependent receptor, partial [Bacteroidales bacterium]